MHPLLNGNGEQVHFSYTLKVIYYRNKNGIVLCLGLVWEVSIVFTPQPYPGWRAIVIARGICVSVRLSICLIPQGGICASDKYFVLADVSLTHSKIMYDYMNYMYFKNYIVYRTIGFNKYILEFWVLSSVYMSIHLSVQGGSCFLCSLLFCNHKNPVCNSMQICSPKGVSVQHKGIWGLWLLTFATTFCWVNLPQLAVRFMQASIL